MKDLRIKIIRDTSFVNPSNDVLGINNENLQGNIICYFDEFVNGTAWLEIEMPDGTTGYLPMTKVDEEYRLEIKSSLLSQTGTIHMQLRITENENINGIPVFKSNIFYVKIKEAINATETIPDEYPTWIDKINTALNEVENLDIISEQTENGFKVTFTDKKGEQTIREIYNGEKGEKGEKGDTGNSGVYLGPEEPVDPEVNVWVDSDGEPDTIDYNTAENKPKINGVELIGNKTSEDLKIPTKTSELIDDSNLAKTNTNNNFSVSQTINGTLTVNGDIVQNGQSYETHAEQLYTKNDLIKTRDGAIGGLGANEMTGIEAINYDGTNNGRLAFDNKGVARVGDVGDEQPLLTRVEATSLTNGQVFVWDNENQRAVGSSEYVKNTEVDAKIANAVKPASQTILGVAKMWTTTNSDGEVTLNISTEA